MTEEKKSKTPKIVLIIVIVIIGIIGVIGGIQYYEKIKWDNYAKNHEVHDNLLTVKCSLKTDDKKIVSCIVNTEEKSNEYDNFSVYIKHDDSIKYLNYNIPTEESVYISHEETSYISEELRDRFYVGNIDRIHELEYLLKVEFEVLDDNITSKEIIFNSMQIEKDNVNHYSDPVTIKLADLTESESNSDTYKYLCVNKAVEKDAIINQDTLTECGSEEVLPYGTLTQKLMTEFGLNLDDNTTYYIKSSKKENEILNIEDIYWRLEPLTETKIKTQVGTQYLLKIGEDKALYIDDIKIFDNEKVKEFYIRPYCCSGGKKILLITEDNNLYFSTDDIDLKQDNIIFKNLHLENIKSFHINNYVPSMGGTHVYAIDNNGDSHLID